MGVVSQLPPTFSSARKQMSGRERGRERERERERARERDSEGGLVGAVTTDLSGTHVTLNCRAIAWSSGKPSGFQSYLVWGTVGWAVGRSRD